VRFAGGCRLGLGLADGFYTLTFLTNSVHASGQEFRPNCISDTGYICGIVPFNNAWQAARWNPDGTIVELGVYDTNTDIVSDGLGINDAGDVSGLSSSDFQTSDNAIVFRGTQAVRVPWQRRSGSGHQ